MIVKVQIAIASSSSFRTALIYNRERSIMYETEATPELLELMGGEKKKYFNAFKDDKGKVKLESAVEAQPW